MGDARGVDGWVYREADRIMVWQGRGMGFDRLTNIRADTIQTEKRR